VAAPLFILAGEPSGDRLAARVMAGVTAARGQRQWIGVGGPAMQEEGLQSAFPMEELTVFGFGAAVRAYPHLSRRMDSLVDLIIAEKPAAVLSVDVKGFSVRLAERLRRRLAGSGNIPPIIHTVAPTVWAWGGWRANRFATAFDAMMCLFPFEPDYFMPLGLDARFISHPEAFNKTYDIIAEETGANRRGDEPAHITVLPGSRRSEISHLLVPMLGALDILRDDFPGLTATLPTLPHLQRLIEQGVQASGLDKRCVKVTCEKDALFGSLAGSDAVIAASGTVTLQTALYGMPGVTCYRAGRISAFIGRRLVDMDKVILPNALSDSPVYPFLFQEEVTPQGLADSIRPILASPQSRTHARTIARTHALALRHMLRGAADSFEANVAAVISDWLD
jgi:lipid-A-disaccharide synthase